MKTREERALEEWFTKNDIEIVFAVNRDVSVRIFQSAHQRDEETLGRSRMYYYGKKVSKESAEWVTGKKVINILRQIKNGATPAK